MAQATNTRRMENLVLVDGGEKTQKFPVDIVFDRESLKRKIDLFGSNSKLDSVFKIGPYGDLVGRNVADFSPIDRSEFTLKLHHFRESVSYVEGSITGEKSIDAPQHIAIACNGLVIAVTQTYASTSNTAKFSALLPESSSSSHLAFYVIRETSKRGRLALVHLENQML